MTSRLVSRPFALMAATVISASCHVIYGLDDFETGAGKAGAGPAQGGGGAGGAGTGEGGGAAGEGGTAPCVCVESLPAEAEALYYVYSSPGDMPVTDCGNGAIPLDYVKVTEPSATCSSCECAPAPGPVCSPPQFWGNYGFACDSNWYDMSASFADYNCYLIGDSDDSGRLNVAPAVIGSCAQSGGGMLQTGAWGEEHALCSTKPDPEGMCMSGQTCIEPPDGDAARLCVLMIDNASSCPPEWPESVAGFRNTPPDTRTCTPCTCGALTADCANAFRIHESGASCTNGSVTPPVNTCLDFLGGRSGKFTQPPASCSGGTSDVQGTFDPGVPATLCCKAPAGTGKGSGPEGAAQ